MAPTGSHAHGRGRKHARLNQAGLEIEGNHTTATPPRTNRAGCYGPGPLTPGDVIATTATPGLFLGLPSPADYLAMGAKENLLFTQLPDPSSLGFPIQASELIWISSRGAKSSSPTKNVRGPLALKSSVWGTP